MSLRLSLALLLLAPACGDSIRGEVAGNDVGTIQSTLFDEEVVDLEAFGSYTGLLVVMTGIEDGCQALAQGFDGGSCSELCANGAEFAQTYDVPDDLWTLFLFITGTTSGMVTTYSQSDDLMPPSFYASIEQDDTSIAEDQAACVAACEAGDDTMPGGAWDATGGTVEITDYTAQEEVKGTFELTFPDGEISGDFHADLCDDLF